MNSPTLMKVWHKKPAFLVKSKALHIKVRLYSSHIPKEDLPRYLFRNFESLVARLAGEVFKRSTHSDKGLGASPLTLSTEARVYNDLWGRALSPDQDPIQWPG